MGNIGPAQQRFEVLPVLAIGLDTADFWTVAPRATVPNPEPMPVPYPEPVPEPSPLPPTPEPAPTPPSTVDRRTSAARFARSARGLR